MTTYLGTSINESSTIILEVGEKLENARGIALAIKNGKAGKPEAGANIIGITILETEDIIKEGEEVDLQIKDIGKWVAAEEISMGTELATDAEGKAVAAKSGDFIVGVALSSASKAGTWLKVQITKSGYKK